MRYRKYIYLILSIIIFCVVLISCQKNPIRQIVINQRDTEYVISDTFKKIELPTEIILSASHMGKALVRFQAEVTPSAATSYPIIKVMPGIFHTDQIRDMLNTLLPENSKLYKPWEKTKEEYIQLMAETYQLDIENEDVKVFYDWLTQTGEQAPLTIQKEFFSMDEVAPNTYTEIFAEYGDGNVASAAFIAEGKSFSFVRDKDYRYIPFSWIEEGEPYEKTEPQISQAEGHDIALKALRSLGIDVPVAPVLVEPVVISRLPKTEWCGWQFYYTRTYSGINTTFADSGVTDWRTPPSIGSPWPKEMIRIIVDQYGVFCFHWAYPIKSAAVEAENIELLSLEDAVSRARQLLLYIYAAASEDTDDVKQVEVDVEKIELMMGVLSVRDQRDVGQSVPVWKFYYTLDTGSTNDREHTWYICISGINGGYVEPDITTQQIEDAAQRQRE